MKKNIGKKNMIINYCNFNFQAHPQFSCIYYSDGVCHSVTGKCGSKSRKNKIK